MVDITESFIKSASLCRKDEVQRQERDSQNSNLFLQIIGNIYNRRALINMHEKYLEFCIVGPCLLDHRNVYC